MKKTAPIDNPVLHFSSATYKCEAEVKRHFGLAAAKQVGALKDIMEGLRKSVMEQVPTATVSRWLKFKKVADAQKYVRIYDRLLQSNSQAKWNDDTTWQKAWKNATPEGARKPQKERDRTAIGRYYIHCLAVWTYKTNMDRDIVIQMFKDELDRIIASKSV